ncbi:Bgt-20142, partial [Blumeria graminis f. sp. tritici]
SILFAHSKYIYIYIYSRQRRLNIISARDKTPSYYCRYPNQGRGSTLNTTS